METQVLTSLCKESGRVIACGGGVVTRERNLDIMRQNGRVVYIKRALDSLDTTGRPLSKKYSVQTLFEQRREAYERFADITVENKKTPTDTAEDILKALKGEN
jgi:shikimate dehydrogenase